MNTTLKAHIPFPTAFGLQGSDRPRHVSHRRCRTQQHLCKLVPTRLPSLVLCSVTLQPSRPCPGSPASAGPPLLSGHRHSSSCEAPLTLHRTSCWPYCGGDATAAPAHGRHAGSERRRRGQPKVKELWLFSGRWLWPHSTALGDAGRRGSEVPDPRAQGRREMPQKGRQAGWQQWPRACPALGRTRIFLWGDTAALSLQVPIHTGFLSVLSSQNLVQPCQH